MTSPTVVEAKVAADRKALNASVAELRARLAPSALSNEVGETLTARVADVGQSLSDKAVTPGGLIALCGMAFSAAFAASGAMRRNTSGSGATAVSAMSRAADAPLAIPTAETARTLLKLSAAIATGAVISRYIPTSDAERKILEGVGPELKQAMQTRITEQAHRLVAPKDDGFGIVNLAAMASAFLLSGKSRGG